MEDDFALSMSWMAHRISVPRCIKSWHSNDIDCIGSTIHRQLLSISAIINCIQDLGISLHFQP